MKEQTQIEHPDYYQSNGVEVWDFISENDLNFFLGNVVKYIVRAGKKSGSSLRDDLQKAINYLDYEIEHADSDMYSFDPSLSSDNFQSLEELISAFNLSPFLGIALRLVIYAMLSNDEEGYVGTLRNVQVFLCAEIDINQAKTPV